MQLKTCSKCKENKSIVSFYRMSTSKDGHRPDCKVCSKEAYKSNIAVGIALHDVNKGHILNNIYLENQEHLTKGALKNRSSKK